MDLFTGLITLMAAFAGFVGGTLMSRVYWLHVYKVYTERVQTQYKNILFEFGIKKNAKGNWEMNNREGFWSKKEG